MIKDRLVEKIVESEKMLDTLFEKQGTIFTFLNPVSYLDAQKNIDLFTSFDGVFSDGALLANTIKGLYGIDVSRNSFDMTSVAPKLFEYAIKMDKSIYVVASKDSEVKKAISILRENYPKLKIIGYRNGYFKDDGEMDAAISKIIDLSPDYLIVGMGVVKQEMFLLRAKKAGFKGIGFSCGGFIHQTSKNLINYYPSWIDKHDFRFLYRMLKEPHTRRRYFRASFVFPIVSFKNKFFSKKNSKK